MRQGSKNNKNKYFLSTYNSALNKMQNEVSKTISTTFLIIIFIILTIINIYGLINQNNTPTQEPTYRLENCTHNYSQFNKADCTVILLDGSEF